MIHAERLVPGVAGVEIIKPHRLWRGRRRYRRDEKDQMTECDFFHEGIVAHRAGAEKMVSGRALE